AFDVRLHNLVDRALFRHVDGLRNGARNKWLHRAHHPQMAGVVNRPGAVRRTEAAIEYRQVLRPQSRRALNRAGGIDVADDGLHLLRRIAEPHERLGHRLVHDLDHAAAHQLLVLHERQIGFNAGRIAIHHEADRAGRRDHRDLTVAVSEFLTRLIGFFPDFLRAAVHVGGNIAVIDAAHRIAVHADYFEERLDVL